MIEAVVMWLVSLALVGWGGFAFGTRHMARSVSEVVDRMTRIDPPDRTPGQPTNSDAAPSRIIRSKWRNTSMKG